MTSVTSVLAILAAAKARVKLAKVSRWPAGTPGGKGGQFSPGQQGGGASWGAVSHGVNSWGMGPKLAPPPSAKPHPKGVDDKGKPVLVHYPTKAGDAAHWGDKSAVATAVPGGAMPAALNGVAFKAWNPPQDWTKAGGTKEALDEADPFEPHPDKRTGAGVIILERDGRMWLTKPTNEFGGYVHSWPKGGVEEGLTLQQTAVKEAWEETGLRIKIKGILGDYEGDTSKARYYIAERIGGTPSDMGWESQAMRLTPPAKLKTLLNRSRDKQIADDVLDLMRQEGIHKGADDDWFEKAKSAAAPSKSGTSQQPRWPAGTSLGGQWKSYDGQGLAMPPTIAGGLGSQNPKYQKQANALYAAIKAGDTMSAQQAVDAMKAKLDGFAAAGSKSSHVKWTQQVHQYGADLLATGPKVAVAEAAADKVRGPMKLADMTQVGGKPGGTAPGAVYADKSGTKWLVKGNLQAGTKSSDDRAKNEVLAAHLLNAVGAGAPQMKTIDLGSAHGGGLGVASKWIDGVTKFDPSNKAHVEAAQKQFAVHAWLGNWDVMGAGFDNTVIKDGKALCIDPGGAILYRAQGTPKAKSQFGDVADEIKSLRDSKVNAQTAAVYGKMTAHQLIESVKGLEAIDEATITKLVDTYGPGDAKGKAELTKTLVARRKNLLDFGAGLAAGLKVAESGGSSKEITAAAVAAATPKPAAEPASAKPKTHFSASSAHIPTPTFATGFEKTDKLYAEAASLAQLYHSKATAGDKEAMDGLVGMKMGAEKGYIFTTKLPEKVSTKSTPSLKLQAFLSALVDDAAPKFINAEAKAEAATATAGKAAKAAADVKVKAAATALPNFDGAKLPASNQNSAAHNAKVDAIKGAAATGDINAILALNYSTNTYGKKQAQLANDALAALGSSEKVVVGQKKGQHPALAGIVTTPRKPIDAPQAATAIDHAVPPKAKPTPDTVAGSLKFDGRPNFENWQGSGKGLSSKPAVNAANQAAVDTIAAVAQKANMDALKALKFDVIDPATGAATGQKKSFNDHPSKHVQAFYQDAIATLDAALNPPRPLKLVDVGAFKTAADLAEHFKAKPLGTTVASAKKHEKFGFWIALGGVSSVAPVKPQIVFNMSAKTIAEGYEHYKKFSPDTKAFIKSMQGSGSFADAYRNGLPSYGGHNLKKLYEAAKKEAVHYAEGTTIYRWQNMPAEMVKQILAAPDGVVYQATGPMPHSHDPTATSGFGKHRVVVRMAPGAKAIPSYGSGSFAGEKEVTSLPKARFVVLSKKWVPDAEHGKPSDKRLEIEVLMLPHGED